jgi:hypothetical protein
MRGGGWLPRMLRVLAVSMLLPVVSSSWAGLPCLVGDDGIPLRWAEMPITYNLGRGPLAVLPSRTIDEEEGADLLETATRFWEEIPTASVQFTPGAPLPSVGAPTAYLDRIGLCGDGVSPVIFDPFGSVTDAALGEGASEFILGFTIHDCGTLSAPRIVESTVVINGGASGALGPNGTDGLVGVIVHELGHVLNLCHSELNAEVANDGDAANDAFLPVMFAFRSGDDPAGDPTPRFDDWSMLSMLYPTPELYSELGTISGHVLAGEPGRPVSGAPVIVRRVADPLVTAQWTTSGWLRVEQLGSLLVPTTGVIAAIDGSYQASGLPEGAYTIEVASVRPGEREFYSGALESGNPRSDPAGLVVPIDMQPGLLRTDVDITLNRSVDSPLSGTEWDVEWRGRLKGAGRIPPDLLPSGALEFLPTGSYRIAPLFELSGDWSPRGKRKARCRLDTAAIRALLGGDGEMQFTRLGGRSRANRRLTRIRGRIVIRGRIGPPPVERFSLRLDYKGRRARVSRPPGRVPIVSAPTG